MKKVVAALIMCMVLATASSAFAQDMKSLIGKKVASQLPVKVDGKVLPVQAVVIDGTSYVPMRAIGEALDMDIEYDPKLGVELNEKGVTSMTPTPTTAPTPTTVTSTMTTEDQDSIKRAEEQIVLAQQRIKEPEDRITGYEKELQTENEKLSQTTDKYETELIQGKISILNENIRVAKEQIKMNQDGIAAQQTYIAKIKAKYVTP